MRNPAPAARGRDNARARPARPGMRRSSDGGEAVQLQASVKRVTLQACRSFRRHEGMLSTGIAIEQVWAPASTGTSLDQRRYPGRRGVQKPRGSRIVVTPVQILLRKSYPWSLPHFQVNIAGGLNEARDRDLQIVRQARANRDPDPGGSGKTAAADPAPDVY